ncbi:methylated-DNA--[protein]-cysteine S-methyltransferase [Sessilibacter corallicola]|uniref:methylated-DNA--[protein]-cysteine S-methyltransferase n=1 Tax=Sessilibacter corallicola TaxID=2904075 RepID=UPI001E47601A|nr:methylated-DNA--[protein]-cysteine S-methyltransferase [Sessilibacter corallicola]MCE2028780.1 methylated-DNA--[protein]-cysteine S-methyltransferase [Sessilibacter corallicola]
MTNKVLDTEVSAVIASPLGELILTGIPLSDSEVELTGIFFPEHKIYDRVSELPKNKKLFENTIIQLNEYFEGTRQEFDLPLRPQGTEFRKTVWEKLVNIPYGETRSYHDISVEINNPKACRAVGAANGANPISIIIPCHRVIAQNGALTGYAGGMDAKQWLLTHEKKFSNKQR